MKTKRSLHVKVAAMIAIAACLAGASAGLRAQRGPATTIAIGGADLAGVVTSSNGPEAGVWVIAETTDLPKATYSVWVRGYGLVDSPKVKTAPGTHLNLTAVESLFRVHMLSEGPAERAKSQPLP